MATNLSAAKKRAIEKDKMVRKWAKELQKLEQRIESVKRKLKDAKRRAEEKFEQKLANLI